MATTVAENANNLHLMLNIDSSLISTAACSTIKTAVLGAQTKRPGRPPAAEEFASLAKPQRPF
jgi:hypothetical protein